MFRIKQLSGEERAAACRISLYCFHSRVDDLEKKLQEAKAGSDETWGAFTENGILAAQMSNNHFHFYLDGQVVLAGGIGDVSSLPEYRNQGAIREIFTQLLPEAYRRGEVISALYPFNHAFYRKQGYETVTFQNNYELSPAVLNGYRFDGSVTRWNPGDPVDAYLRIYEKFSGQYNFTLQRDAAVMLDHMKVDRVFRDRKFTYLFRQNGVDLAYLIFTDVRHDPAAILQVEECAWVNRSGFYAILGFLARFTADYGNIQLPLPQGIDLLRLIQSPQAYDIHKTHRFAFMVRVINAQKLLKTIRKPDSCDFVIRVEDELIKENNQTLRVTSGDVVECDLQPDLAVNVRALGQMATGCINLDEAMLRPDVEIFAKEDMLRAVFTEKKIYVGEHF